MIVYNIENIKKNLVRIYKGIEFLPPQPDDVYLSYFKLTLFDPPKLLV